MTNREKYAKEILDIVCEGSDVAVKNGVPSSVQNNLQESVISIIRLCASITV